MELIKFDEKVTCGPEYVAVRILDNCSTLSKGGIFLPDSAAYNSRLAFCQIEDLGAKSKKETGLKNGDYVYIDRLSTFGHTFPVALLKYGNVVLRTSKDRKEIYPLRNMLFVIPEKKETVSKVGNILVPNFQDKLKIGKIWKMNCDKELNLPFKSGERVMLAQKGDHVVLGTLEIYIYRYDALICSIK